MSRINLLPKWVLPDTIPSVYDCTSGSWVEMAAKLYGAMRELQTDYNSFVDELNETITDYTNSTTKDQEEFKNHITTIMHNYIMKIDEKIKLQDLTIANAIKYMKDNLSSSISSLLAEMKEMGELDDVIIQSISNIETSISEINDNIATNTDNIATNTNDIINLQNDVTDLQNNKTEYNYDEVNKKIFIYSLTERGEE